MIDVIEWFVINKHIVGCAIAGTAAALVSTGVRYLWEQHYLSKEIDDYMIRRKKSGKVDIDDYMLNDYDDSQDLHAL